MSRTFGSESPLAPSSAFFSVSSVGLLAELLQAGTERRVVGLSRHFPPVFLLELLSLLRSQTRLSPKEFPRIFLSCRRCREAAASWARVAASGRAPPNPPARLTKPLIASVRWEKISRGRIVGQGKRTVPGRRLALSAAAGSSGGRTPRKPASPTELPVLLSAPLRVSLVAPHCSPYRCPSPPSTSAVQRPFVLDTSFSSGIVVDELHPRVSA